MAESSLNPRHRSAAANPGVHRGYGFASNHRCSNSVGRRDVPIVLVVEHCHNWRNAGLAPISVVPAVMPAAVVTTAMMAKGMVPAMMAEDVMAQVPSE